MRRKIEKTNINNKIELKYKILILFNIWLKFILIVNYISIRFDLE